MTSEEYLLLAEIEYWREMIESRKKILTREALSRMAWSQSQAVKKLDSIREEKITRLTPFPDTPPVFV